MIRAIFTCISKNHDVIEIVLTVSIFVIGFLIERKTRKIQTAMTWKEFRDPVLAFSREVIETMSEAAGLCEADPVKFGQDKFWERYNENLSKLTAQIDYGRLVIPNLSLKDNSAYGGLRQQALDCIYVAYTVSKEINYNSSAHNFLPTKNILDQQYILIKNILSKLPDPKAINAIEIAADFKGWSCKLALVQAKRQFVEEVSKLIEARRWANDIKSLSSMK